MAIFFGILLVLIMITSPFVVIALLVERSHLHKTLREKEGYNPTGDAEYSRGYYQALEDVEVTAKVEKTKTLSVVAAVERLRATAGNTNAVTVTESTDVDEMSKAAPVSAEVTIEQRSAEDIWGGTLDGSWVDAATNSEDDKDARTSELVKESAMQIGTSGMSQQAIINTVLFSGALLIVGAAAAFVVTSASPALKALSMGLTVLAFYGGGTWLCGRERLSQVGLAFLGIGLALVPFAGIVLSMTLDIAPIASWFIVSLVGVILSVHTAWLVRSEVASYVALLSVLSLALALSRNVTEDIFWLILPIVLVGFAMQLVRMMVPKAGGLWVVRPLGVMSVASPLVALLLSAPLFVTLGFVKVEILLAVVLVQFSLHAVQTKSYIYELLARSLGVVLFAVIGGHIADNTGISMQIAIGVSLSVAFVAQLLISALLWRRRDGETKEVEQILVPLYVAAGWLIALNWLFGQVSSTTIVTVQLLAVALQSVALSVFLRQKKHLYSVVVAFWLLPYAALGLGQVGTYAQELAWYYVAVSALLCGTYAWLAGSQARSLRWLASLGLGLHLASGVAHGIALGAAPLALSLFVGVASLLCLGLRERKAELLVVAHAVGLLAAQQLLRETVEQAALWQVLSTIIAVAVVGWGAGELLRTRRPSGVQPRLLESSLALLTLAWLGSLATAVEHQVSAYTGVIALLVGVGMIAYRGVIRKSLDLQEAAVYGAAAAALYALFIVDASSKVPFVAYALSAAFIAVGLAFYKGAASLRRVHFTVALWLLGVGVVSTLQWVASHDVRGLWGASLLGFGSVVLYGHAAVSKRQAALEVALYVGVASLLLAVAVLDKSSVLPLSSYAAIFGLAGLGAGLLPGSTARRTKHFKASVGVLFVAWVATWSAASLHETAAFWGAFALFVAAVVLRYYAAYTGSTKTIEAALYTCALAVCYMLFIFDISASLPFIVYLHIAVLAVAGAAFLYKADAREYRLKWAAGLLVSFVGLKALSEGGAYQLLFLVENALLLLAGAATARRWLMLVSTAAISVAVLYMLRDNSWLVLLLIGLMLVGYAVHRSVRSAQIK
jgi:hypothetical protein